MADAAPPEKPLAPWRERLFQIIFGSDTQAGKAFDVALIWLIVLSVAAVMLESVARVRVGFGQELLVAEWFFTIVFTIEYALRLICVRKPTRYVTSFFGYVDLLAILPTYLSLIIPGAQSLLVIRAFRLLRVFRVLKLGPYLAEAQVLTQALQKGRPKIAVFLLGVFATVTTVGALMYLVEGEEHGFTSIPMSIYWAIVTMTTVGFGDITPQTDFGKVIASTLMIIGYGVIAIPTGIVTTELVKASLDASVDASVDKSVNSKLKAKTEEEAKYGARIRAEASALTPHATNSTINCAINCPECSASGHDQDARYCKHCGARL